MGKIIAWFQSKFVPETSIWWKTHSMQLGALAVAALTYLAANPDAWTKFVAQLPPAIASSIPVWVGSLAALLIFVARFWKQFNGDK